MRSKGGNGVHVKSHARAKLNVSTWWLWWWWWWWRWSGARAASSRRPLRINTRRSEWMKQEQMLLLLLLLNPPRFRLCSLPNWHFPPGCQKKTPGKFFWSHSALRGKTLEMTLNTQEQQPHNQNNNHSQALAQSQSTPFPQYPFGMGSFLLKWS